ncbi:MAG TPA: coproporphyrinogen-III oxidase family protein [Candidatus Ozemobacteraceae bacterium]|nr:coproporphyrinogen-III oxidase family protein [Candidatus Ozemobacteraceae bacterium]
MSDNQHLGLYIHVPFCRSKCSYCGFFSLPFAAELCELWLQHLFVEFDRRIEAEKIQRVRTAFIGGGNPTVLPLAQFTAFVDGLQRRLEPSPIKEWTFETNPETFTREHLAVLRSVSGLRLSFGLQRLRDDELTRIGRQAHASCGLRALEQAFSTITNVGADFILGVPGLPSLAGDLDLLLHRFPLTHVSTYFLTAEPNTPLAREIENGRFPDPAECGPEELFEVRAALERHGLQQYEISNFALPGRECLHNLHYWYQGDYIGIGPAAVSTLDGIRTANPEGLEQWINGEHQIERLSPIDQRREYLMLRLRLLREGFSPIDYASRFGIGVNELVQQLDTLVDRGDLTRTPEGYALSISGMSVANRIISELF